MKENGKKGHGKQVVILMGSDSDFEKLKPAVQVLKEFGLTYEMRVLSAHRSPKELTKYLSSLKQLGTKVIIAAAGGAAHLAGVCAAHVVLPVIGVPVETSNLGGLDSLLSTVQMPGGIPVATMGIGESGAKNAGLMAVEILALADEKLVSKLEHYKEKLEASVKEKNDKLQKQLLSLGLL